MPDVGGAVEAGAGWPSWTAIRRSDRGVLMRSDVTRRLTTAIKESLRELNIQLSLLIHHVGARSDH
jgi:hypothetical protein